MQSSLLQNRFQNFKPFKEGDEESKSETVAAGKEEKSEVIAEDQEDQEVESETIDEEEDQEGVWVEVCSKATKTRRRKTVIWKNLPRDVTGMIFAKLDLVEMLASVPLVCQLWRNISKQPGSITRLDLHSYKGDPYVKKILKFVTKAVDRSGGELVEFSANRFISDDIVDYVVANTKSLRSLRFSCGSYISGKGLINAIRKAPFLEELELFGGHFNKEMAEEIVCSCPRLKSFRINSKGHKIDEAGLNEGLQIILNGCPNLECLDLELYVGVSLIEDLMKYKERIRISRLSNKADEDDGGDYDDEYYADYVIFEESYYFHMGESCSAYYPSSCSSDRSQR